jgi:two-component system, cell cycle response regulator
MSATALIVGKPSAHQDAIAKKVESTRLFNHILTCTNTFQILNCLRNSSIDLVFCHLEEPVAKKLAWLKELRKQDNGKDIPVLVFTDGKGLTEKILPLEVGASDCLSCFTSAEEIAARVRLQLRNKERIEQLLRAKSELAHLALTDSLTGLYNRAFFDAALESEIARSERAGKPFSLLMIDLDHFKKINDTYGHSLGDKALQTVAAVLKNTIRKSDTACRYGGEEFAIILPATSIPHANIAARRIHKEIGKKIAETHQNIQYPVTVSIGIRCVPGSTAILSKDIVEQADLALYAAKRGGRNRTEIFTPDRTDFSESLFLNETTSNFALA